MVLGLVLGPGLPGSPEVVDGHAHVPAESAAVAQECADRAGQVLELADRLAGRARLGKAVPDTEPVEPIECPVHDPGQLRQEPREQARVLLAVEGLGEDQDDEPLGQRTGRIGEARQLVGEQHEAHLERTGPGVLELAVDGDGVLAGHGQQPFGERLDVGLGTEARVGHDREGLADEVLEAEVRGQASKGRRADVVLPEQVRQDPRDDALAGPRGSHQQHDLLEARVPREGVTEHLLEQGDRVRVVVPQVRQEGQPAGRLGGNGVVGEWHAVAHEEAGVVGQQLAVGQMEDAVGGDHEVMGIGQPLPRQPCRRLDRRREVRDGRQRLERVGDLCLGGVPRLPHGALRGLGLIDGMLEVGIRLRADRRPVPLWPAAAVPGAVAAAPSANDHDAVGVGEAVGDEPARHAHRRGWGRHDDHVRCRGRDGLSRPCLGDEPSGDVRRGIRGIPAGGCVRRGCDPINCPGDGHKLGRDPLQVAEARSVGVRPEDHVHGREGQEGIAARDGRGTGDGAHGENPHGSQGVGGLLALDQHGPLSAARHDVIDPIERERRGRHPGQPLAPVALPPHPLGAIGAIEAHVLDPLGRQAAVGQTDAIAGLAAVRLGRSGPRRTGNTVGPRVEVRHREADRHDHRLGRTAGVAGQQRTAVVACRDREARVAVLMGRATGHPRGARATDTIEPVEQKPHGFGHHRTTGTGGCGHPSRTAPATYSSRSCGRTRTARPMRTDRRWPSAMSFQAIERLMAKRCAISSIRSRRTAAPSTGSMAFPCVDICGILRMSTNPRELPCMVWTAWYRTAMSRATPNHSMTSGTDTR